MAGTSINNVLFALSCLLLAAIPFRATVGLREALLLFEEGGLNVDEIAAATGVDKEAAKSRLRYAFNKLRRAFEE